MGADFLFGHLVWKGSSDPDKEEENRVKMFDQVRQRLQNLTLEEGKAYAGRHICTPEEADDMTQEELAEIREGLLADLDMVEEASLNSREVGYLFHKDSVIMLTGGMSYGDAPNEICRAIWNLYDAEVIYESQFIYHNPR